MRTHMIRLSAIAVIALAVLTGCSKTATTGTSGLSQVTPSASIPPASAGSGTGPATTGPTSSTTTTPATTQPTTKPPAQPTYGTTPQAYATNALNAYTHNNKTFLNAYADAGGVTSFKFLGTFNNHWHFHACANDGGNQDCFFDNDSGDRINIMVIPSLLGMPHAVHTVSIDRVEYGNDADGAVTEFLQAWVDGNTYRMKALADSKTTTLFLKRMTPTTWMLSDDTTTSPGHTLVMVDDHVNDLIDLAVINSKIGHAHSITIID